MLTLAGCMRTSSCWFVLSVEWPLVLVAARDLGDDHSFVTGTSALSLTLATLGVDDSCIAKTYEILLLLKLLMPLSKSK
jgi:hypothetical protein